MTATQWTPIELKTNRHNYWALYSFGSRVAHGDGRITATSLRAWMRYATHRIVVQ